MSQPDGTASSTSNDHTVVSTSNDESGKVQPTWTSIADQPMEMLLAAMDHGDPRATDEFVRRVVEYAQKNGAIPADAVVTYGFPPDAPAARD